MATKAQQNDNGTVSDSVTKETQKGYANYEKEQKEAQKKLDTEDAKFKETVKSGVEKVRGVLGLKKGGTASARADGAAIRGKTRGKIC